MPRAPGECMDDTNNLNRSKSKQSAFEQRFERLADKKIVKKIIDTIAPNWWDFSKDPNKFLAAREKIAQQIVNYKKADE